ncbi:DUF3267 domain-containing protein [Virgibacillus sediminis]|uniref:DUF3267 domain-containing protein n=1 Tax=Virgibacillus sediminis TaxID=202260 RepID=A0ABV7A8R9_9BACI
MEQKSETVVSVSMLKLNVWVLAASIVLLVGVGLLHVLLFGEASLTVTFSGLLLFFIAMMVIVCLHEVIHLVGFRYIGGVSRQELAWGFNWKMGVVYAHAKKPITVEQMQKVLLLPLVPTGLLPMVLGVALDHFSLSILGVLLTAGCFGDFVLYRKLSKFPGHATVLDHPSKPEFTVYE